MLEARHRIEREQLLARALGSGIGLGTGTFSVGGRRIAVRCAGADHWAQLSSVLLPAEGAAALSLDLWDPSETGDRPARGEWPPGSELRPGSHREALGLLPGGSEVAYAGPDFDVRLERRTGRLSGWVLASRLPPWHRLRPWQSLFVPALADQGVETVHASMVARRGAGVLFPGANGAGKSSTAFACLAAGLDVLGDDAIGIEVLDGAPLGHTLHAVAKLSERGIARFPVLAAKAVRYEDPAEPEFFVTLARPEPPRAVATARLTALAFPRLSDSDESTARSLRPSRAASDLLRQTLSAEPARLAQLLDWAVTLAEAVPAFTLDVGRDPDGLVAAVEEILDRAA